MTVTKDAHSTYASDSCSTSMPWKIYGSMTDDELKALWMYMQTVPVRKQGNRQGNRSLNLI